MDLKTLIDIPPWDWPEDAAKMFLGLIGDKRADASDRLVAVELAGNFTAINDELAEALLLTVQDGGETEDLRGKAAISLGPALDYADMMGFEDPDDIPISEKVFHKIQESFRELSMDTLITEGVRRRILEASVRAPQDWHHEAVRAASASDDESWQLTAVFCMRYIRGFDSQILDALKSKNPDIHYEALCAAGNWRVEEAWPHIASLLSNDSTDKPLLLAAIDAVASIRPSEAAEILAGFIDSDDEDIAEAAGEALLMAEGSAMAEDYDEDDDDEFLS